MKRAARISKALRPKNGRARILLWAFIVSLILGALDFWMPLEEYLRSQRNRLHPNAASGEIVLVAIDDRSLQEVGAYPWPRHQFADLITKLGQLGAKRVFIQIALADKTDEANDAVLVQALKPFGDRAVLPIGWSSGFGSERGAAVYPMASLREIARLAHTNASATPWGAVPRLSYYDAYDGRKYASFAATLGHAPPELNGEFPIDYSIDPATVPTASSVDVLHGKLAAGSLRGKDVVVGATFHPYPNDFYALTYGRLPDPYLHILGAETLKSGIPYRLSWLWPFLGALLLASTCLVLHRRKLSLVVIPSAIVIGMVAPLALELKHVFTDVMPGVFLLTYVGIGFAWSRFRLVSRERATTNAVSGLPNLTALNEDGIDTDRALVAARVHNYAAIVSTLSVDSEKALVLQMAKRLMVGATEPMLYQGDEGIFAWFAEPAHGTPVGIHLDALHSLFRSPVVVHDRQFDLVVTFGFDAEPDRLIANRLASALVAADEAYDQGLKWKEHDRSRLEDSAWKLSLLSQLDAAIDSGDLWVAYQPKLDLKSNRIIGAEALARWTHSEKGPISPMEFILAAEQSNRIEKLTHYVLEHAIKVAASINEHMNFDISVNLSARLIDDSQLASITRRLLAKHGLAPERLTLEVTETAALGDATRSLSTLRELRRMGVALSVDDYGTGMSTLDYLQRIPATEIKIDRSFIEAMRTNRATKVMVNSTIQLAHSLGQKVVAEGVEDDETLEELRRMQCDVAQGYLIGKPMSFQKLKKMLPQRREDAA